MPRAPASADGEESEIARGGGHAVQNTGSSRDSTEMITPWLLNLRQAAKYLGCSFWTIRDYALQGLICAVRLLWLRRSEA